MNARRPRVCASLALFASVSASASIVACGGEANFGGDSGGGDALAMDASPGDAPSDGVASLDANACPTTDCVCRPGEIRCDPGAPEQTQTCAADGQRWSNGALCDGAAGEHCSFGRCGNPCANLGASYLGCEYWPTVTVNGSLATEFEYAVAVANTQAYPIEVSVEGGALGSPMTRRVGGNSVEVLRLPWVEALSQNTGPSCCAAPFAMPGMALCAARSSRAPGGAYRLRANAPVAVYQFNPLEFRRGSRFSYTNDASLLLPQNALGRQYIVFSYSNDGPPFSGPTDRCSATSLRGGFLSVVAAQTEGANAVTVRTPCAVFDPGNPTRTLPAGLLNFTLARGEVLQLVAQGVNGDLTGAVVEASGPVAVFSGHDCTTVAHDRPACDHIEEQLMPVAAWGRSYAVSPLQYRSSTPEPAVVRVLASRDNVSLSFDGITAPSSCARTLDRGQFCEFEAARGFVVTGTGPISVAQYMRGLGDVEGCTCGGGVCADGPQCAGDPALVLESPVEQFRTGYTFLVPSTYVDNYVNIVAPEGAGIELDGAEVTARELPTGAGLTTRVVRMEPGSHQLRSSDGSTRFGLKVYGVAPYTSYAYPGGLDVEELPPG